MTWLHDPVLWLAVVVILAIIYVPIGIVAALRGWVTQR